MKKFSLKNKILRFFGLVSVVFVLAGCKGPQNVDPVQNNAEDYKLEFIKPANGSLTAKLENGTAIKSGGRFKEGTTILFTATPNNDYKVNKWENAEPTNADKTQAKLTIGKADVTVKVSFSKIEKPATDGVVTFSAGENGKIKANINGTEIQSGKPHKANTEIYFTAIPDEGYKVASWDPEDAIKLKSTDSKLEGTHTVTGDISIKVNFAPLSKLQINFRKDPSILSSKVKIIATAGKDATAQTINSGETIKQGERIQFEATGFDKGKYKAEWTVTRGNISNGVINGGITKIFPTDKIWFNGSYTSDGRDIDATLKLIYIPAKVGAQDTDEITVSGKTNVENKMPQYVYIKLTDDKLLTSKLEPGKTDLTSWFTNIPEGLTAKVNCAATMAFIDEDKAEGTCKGVKVEFWGAATSASSEEIKVTIPADFIKNSQDLIVNKLIFASNSKAKYNISKGPKFNIGNIKFDNGGTDVTLKSGAKIEVKYNPSRADLYVFEISNALEGFNKKTHSASCEFTLEDQDKNKQTISGNYSRGNFIGNKSAVEITEDSTVTAKITVTNK
ncbi:MAG: hypothetical protein P1P64_09885 [Treponemataceae bacterium]